MTSGMYRKTDQRSMSVWNPTSSQKIPVDVNIWVCSWHGGPIVSALSRCWPAYQLDSKISDNTHMRMHIDNTIHIHISMYTLVCADNHIISHIHIVTYVSVEVFVQVETLNLGFWALRQSRSKSLRAPWSCRAKTHNVPTLVLGISSPTQAQLWL